MRFKAALFAATATVALAPAANAYEGLYGAIGAGLAYMGDDREINSVTSPLAFNSEADHDKGIGVYTALGYNYGNGWRTELEFNYRDNDARHWTSDVPDFSGFSGGTLTGSVSSWAVMANIIRDLNVGSDSFVPYIGAGIGYASLESELVGVNPIAANGLSPLLVDDRDGNIAYQGIMGVAIGLAENVLLDISYRYFRTLNAQFDGTLAGSPLTYDTSYVSHSVYAGLRWNFGGSGPAKVQYKDCWDGSSVPASAECPPQLVEQAAAIAEPIEIVIYFDYDKSNLTPEAQDLIRQSAARALENDVSGVKVEGNADRSGSDQYNQDLSDRRSNVVRDALVAAGIPASAISTVGLGETNPAKPTPDGVREPLNRRTEVRITFQ
jgi:outer membrane protein OmpA-like peptidoglycan-associated protein